MEVDCLKLRHLPSEVIDKIIGHLDIVSLTNLFLLYNQLLQDSAEKPGQDSLSNSLLRYFKTANVAFTNRTKSYTNLVMYLLTESYVKKKNMQIVSKPLQLLNLLKLHRDYNVLAGAITISYYIWDLSDLEEFFTILGILSSYELVHMKLELEFDPALLHIVDLQRIFEFYHLKTDLLARVFALSITKYHGQFSLNMNDFPHLRILWLIGSNITFATPLPAVGSKLEVLNISPNSFTFNLNKSALIKSLPVGLLSLILNHVTIHKSIFDLAQLPCQLSTVSLIHIRDLTYGEFVTKLLYANFASGFLRTVTLQDLFEIKEDYAGALFEMIIRFRYLLELLSIGKNAFKKTHVYPDFSIISDYKAPFLHKLKLNSLPINHSVITSGKILGRLTKLDLCNNDLSNVNDLELSPYLVELYLSYNPINWRNFDLTLPSTLKRFEVKNTHLRYLHHLHLPEGLETLGLEVNDIESIEHYKFPINLKGLGLGSNRIRSITHHCLPSKLTILHLTENLIDSPIDLSYNSEGHELEDLFAVYLNHNRIKSLAGFRFPNNLKVLNLDDNNLKTMKNFTFNQSLRELSLDGCNITQINSESIKFPSQLKSLQLNNNKLKLLPRNFPKSLEILDVNYNKLSTVNEDQFQGYVNLKHLAMHDNELEIINLDLSGTSMLTLDLSNNVIKFLCLKFHNLTSSDITTSLVSLNLSNNQLSAISPKILGETSHVKHSNLKEVDMSNNSKLEPNLIDLKQFTLLSTFIWGVTGEQDQFGYDIGANLIKDSYCIGKRLEV